MIPLVLGGIALAAVGYGVKEYCESEGCPWDEGTSGAISIPTNTFVNLHKQKVELYENVLPKLKELLLQINQKDTKYKLKNMATMPEETLAQSDIEEDVKVYARMYKDVLGVSTRLVEDSLVELQTLVDANTEYESYSKAERKVVKKAYKLVTRTQKILALQLLEGKVLNVKVIEPLKELGKKTND